MYVCNNTSSTAVVAEIAATATVDEIDPPWVLFENAADSRESIKRGMIRYLYLAIDLSKTMADGDMRPSRLAVTLRIVQDFVTNYFDQNPLSQLGILVTRYGKLRTVRQQTLFGLTTRRLCGVFHTVVFSTNQAALACSFHCMFDRR